jgi:hypothetical protein
MENSVNGYRREIVPARPVFDMEMLLGLLQETRMDGGVMAKLADTWERWLSWLHALVLDTGKSRYLAIWLEETVEKEVDETFAASPTEGFRLNALAQALCMGAVCQALPEVEDAGCAPSPEPDETLRAALTGEGIPFLHPAGPPLCRRFSVLTHYPFRGACDVCFLEAGCPRAGGREASFHSVVLPGMEDRP